MTATRATETTGYRTRLRAGQGEAYDRIHSRIPERVEAALRSAGVVDWRIWRDGEILFHTIATEKGRDAMLRAMGEFGPLDPEWDDLIATLVDSAPGSDAVLPLVWGMDPAGQFGD